LVEQFCRELALPRVGAEILLRRGYHDLHSAQRLLDSGIDDLHDPWTLPDLGEAARRILRAIESRERIVVHGDYDADGITGTALLTQGLRQLGAEVAPFVPDRMRDGYGVAERLIQHLIERQVRLLITVDTGSSAHAQLERARAAGIDVIVCDHHLFDHRPSGATYFVNPQRVDSAYPHRELCGCAVAWKLLDGVLRLVGRPDESGRSLDLVAIGVLADQMPLHGENRALVRLGLEILNRSPRPGLAQLIATCRREGLIRADDVLFQIAPRINAAGRIERARTALDLLLGDDPREGRELASRIDQLNRRRRELDRQTSEEAIEAASEQLAEQSHEGLVLASREWHLGIVGIGAARVARRFQKPTVLLAIEEGEARGSARSVAGFDLKAALDRCADLLTRYGGHPGAAGLSLPVGRVEEFRQRFAAVAAELPRAAQPPGLEIDAQLALTEIGPDLAEFLERFDPCGSEHPAPRFASYGLRLGDRPQIVGGEHLRVSLGDGGKQRSFIGFHMEDRAAQIREWARVDVAYRVRHRAGSRFDPWELRLEDARESSAVDPPRER
jgi:single-stranded-DNA-specific exonuclease